MREIIEAAESGARISCCQPREMSSWTRGNYLKIRLLEELSDILYNRQESLNLVSWSAAN